MKAALSAAVAMLAACAAPPTAPSIGGNPSAVARETRGYSQRSFERLQASMRPGMLAIAARHDPFPRTDFWGRPEGWHVRDLNTPPSLGFGSVGGDAARRMNSLIAAAAEGPPPARPFVLTATGAERERAVFCLTQAIYYEAALEPRLGQEAVAQTVINRLRHPEYPKTICGVVYQGSQRITGCQFSFTCDGSRERAPMPEIWARCREVAERALRGHVAREVGTATFYHADYVYPAWGPLLVKITQIGRHIFYRFPGPMGATPAFTGRWRGSELAVSMLGPPRADAMALAAAEARNLGPGAPAGAPSTIYTIVDPTAPGGLRRRVAGQVLFGRRAPTPEEIARINENLAELEQRRAGEADTQRPMSTAPADPSLPPPPVVAGAAPAQPRPQGRRGQPVAPQAPSAQSPQAAAPTAATEPAN